MAKVYLHHKQHESRVFDTESTEYAEAINNGGWCKDRTFGVQEKVVPESNFVLLSAIPTKELYREIKRRQEEEEAEAKDKAENAAEVVKEGEIRVKVVINTTNLIDSHMDCHMKGLWKKSLSEQKKLKLLKEHKATFENVVSDQVTATAKTMTWKSLGYDMEGSTQALIFDATIKEERAPYMFGQYKNGYVDNHSVGMRYVTLYLCMNNDKSWAAEEKSNWDKYYSEVANKEIADQYGYFWAVTEAKVIEGSAVVKGSNYATPTISVKENTEEPLESTQTENKEGSRQSDTMFDFKQLKVINN